MGIRSFLNRLISNTPSKPVTGSPSDPGSARSLPIDIAPNMAGAARAFPEPFLADAARLCEIMDRVRQGEEFDRKYVFDVKKKLLVIDQGNARIHRLIAEAIWPAGYDPSDLNAGRLRIEYAEGVVQVTISDFSTSFLRKYNDLMYDRHLVKEHIEKLLAGRNCEFADIAEDFVEGLIFSIKFPETAPTPDR